MRLRGAALAVCVLLGTAGAVPQANASQTDQDGSRRGGNAAEEAAASRPGPVMRSSPAAQVGRNSGRVATARPLQCVPYARMVSGIEVYGNGGQWWNRAAGLYSRGQRPEPGSVMAFRTSGRMPLGHVAVVSRVVGARHVLIEHANWAPPGARKGQITRDVSVVDVSPANDWTAVRVQVGSDPGAFGSVYATYGFIYNRPETGTAYAAAKEPAPAGRRGPAVRFEQLAEMPQDVRLERFGIGPSAGVSSRR